MGERRQLEAGAARKQRREADGPDGETPIGAQTPRSRPDIPLPVARPKDRSRRVAGVR